MANYLIGYGVALLVWLVINTITLLLSIFSKKNLLLDLVALTGVIIVLLGLAAGIGDLLFIIWLFQQNQIFWAVVLIFVGIGVVSFVAQILSFPFTLILSGFTAWCDTLLGIESQKNKSTKESHNITADEVEPVIDKDEYFDDEL